MGERGGETSDRSISRPQTRNGERWFPKGDTVHSSVNEGEQTKTIKDRLLFTVVKPLTSSTSSTNDFALLFRDKTEAARGEFLYLTTSHSYLLISARILLFLPVTMEDWFLHQSASLHTDPGSAFLPLLSYPPPTHIVLIFSCPYIPLSTIAKTNLKNSSVYVFL